MPSSAVLAPNTEYTRYLMPAATASFSMVCITSGSVISVIIS